MKTLVLELWRFQISYIIQREGDQLSKLVPQQRDMKLRGK